MMGHDDVFTESSSTETKRSVVENLSCSGACPMCVLRFLGVKRPSAYSSSSSAQNVNCIDNICSNDANSEPFAKRTKKSECVTCLGMLLDLCDDDSVSNIASRVRAAGYDASTFLFSVSVPASLQIRQFSMLLHLKSQFADVYKDRGIEDFPSVKEAWKWAVGPRVEKQLGMTFQIGGGLDVTVNFVYEDDDNECNNLEKLVRFPKRRNRGWSRSAVLKLLTDDNLDSFRSVYSCPPSMPCTSCRFGPMTFFHAPLFIAGRYNKYSRRLSQTPWIIDGEKLMENSVQDHICNPIERQIQADEIVFSASGREDVDVRTLGKGRPFLLQVVNPKRTKLTAVDMAEIQNTINEGTTDVAVRHLQVVTKEDTKKLKEGEEEKIKTYSALCYVVNPLTKGVLERLNDMVDLEIRQKTPIRVLHRRTAAVRNKLVHSMKAVPIDDHHFQLHLNTQAGTYIKEFVHGDFGRTTPNLRTLLVEEVDILELDVQSVELDWPPEI